MAQHTRTCTRTPHRKQSFKKKDFNIIMVISRGLKDSSYMLETPAKRNDAMHGPALVKGVGPEEGLQKR